ncbi:Coiled-coil domain-containing protein 55 [Harpegnathos saltator]|uniref:Coiled-coil domain-containing protein 55 n=1 Tax=Harpegnathos saltator TaxID=610380 RepID=E2BG80_HARSA|nr:Coiled-coil domain-containing protein 55 [Harpegnathos saltator]
MASNKQYGLILPKKQQKTTPKLSNVFGDDNASDEDDGSDWVRKALRAEGEKNKMKKQTKLNIQKALDEDPTIYQYDEVYDAMEHTKSKVDVNKHKDKKPRYIENLLKTAERRKKEQEHRIERMVQKEREAEGEMYADKESFVTSAYRAKLEEFKKMEEEEDKMSRLEAIGDVTKQQDMSGFYRHLYEQTVNYQDQSNNDETCKKKEKDIESRDQKILANNKDEARENITNEATNTTDERSKASARHKKPRQYRQRAIETYDSDLESEANKEEQDQPVTPPMNKDTDKLEIQEPEKKKHKLGRNDLETNKCTTEPKNKNSDVTNDKIPQESKKIISENEKVVSERKVADKENRSIWEKRTVGSVFEAALQRYYARKATRLAAV